MRSGAGFQAHRRVSALEPHWGSIDRRLGDHFRLSICLAGQRLEHFRLLDLPRQATRRPLSTSRFAPPGGDSAILDSPPAPPGSTSTILDFSICPAG